MFGYNWKIMLPIICALMLLAGIKILIPQFVAVGAIAMDAMVHRSKLEPPENISADLLQLRSARDAINSQIDGTLRHVPNQDSLAIFYRILGSAATSSRVQLRKVKPRPITSADRFNELAIDADISGDFGNLLTFLEKLEAGTQLFRVQGLNLKASGKQGNQVSGTLKLTAHVRHKASRRGIQ